MLTSDRRLLVLDDDPTGSQCVHDISVEFAQDAALLGSALSHPGTTCFTLTNSRALDEPDAARLSAETVRDVVRRLREDCGNEAVHQLHVISRSDSTLRGHAIAEPHAIAEVLQDEGLPVDGFLFCPAMLEAGRFTRDDVHYAVVGQETRRVEDTDFARDATFGYSTSDLKDFLEERSGSAIHAEDVLSVSLTDIRDGGVPAVISVLEKAVGGRWVVINAEEYSDMQVVADAVTELEADGRRFVTRCGPSFVRPLAGQSDTRILEAADLASGPDRAAHGLVVVGSHVGLTTQQLEELRRRRSLTEQEIDVRKVLDPSTRQEHLTRIASQVRQSLEVEDVAIYTSRDLVSTDDPAESLAIARSVSDAVVEVVALVRSAKPSWVIAKGGITSHEVAHQGLGIRLADVAGQFFPGQISLFRPVEADSDVLGCPYVVFPGNVGGTGALADVVERLQDLP